MLVLVVEDSESLAAMVKAALEECGHEVIVAASLEEAFEAYERYRFAVVLCDFELPKVPGGLNDGRGTDFLEGVVLDAEKPERDTLTILWSGLDRSREAARDMKRPPDHVTTKDRLPEVLALIERHGDAAAGAA